MQNLQISKETLELPWKLLPIEVKQWVKDNGYLLTGDIDTNSAKYYSEWRNAYCKKFNLK